MANDWETLPELQLLQRIAPLTYNDENQKHFKGWLRLTSLQTNDKKLIGRCAISTRHRGKAALGVTKGILAGYIEGMTGVIQSQPQTDLSRQTALPDISRRHLQAWAEQQKDILYSLGVLDMERSEVLAEYGASHEQLIIGTLGSEEVSQEYFITRLHTIGTLFVHRGEIEYEGDDDVRESEFKNFMPEPEVLALNRSYFQKPTWTSNIPNEGIDDKSWSIRHAFESALLTVWEDESHWNEEDEFTIVGNIDGTEIERLCEVYTHKPIDEE